MTETEASERPPLASVGIPVHNGGQSLESVLAALRRQTLRDVEFIISDNASGDDTPDICRRAVAADPRIRYFRQVQLISPTENFNFVLGEARAPYFMWAAHDDYRDNDYLEKLIRALESNPATVLACGDIVEVRAGVARSLDLKFDTRGRSRCYRLYRAALFQLHHLYGVWRTEAVRKIRWEHVDWWHDTPFMMAASMLGDFRHVPGTTFYYHFTPKHWFFAWPRQPGLKGRLTGARAFLSRASNVVALTVMCGRSVYRVANVWCAALALLLGGLKIAKQVFDFFRVRASRHLSRA
jgi:glycosyltransferase involved in cell wall biosynthesis